MQPFDGDKFDHRYKDTFAPAIKDAGLEPYRVDEDPSVQIPIEQIEAGIRNAELCLADITLDNPNVWFELGYAISARKDVILICSNERQTKLPFDVQHRTIIKYKVDSMREYQTLRQNITDRAKSILKKKKAIEQLPESVVKSVEGLRQEEMSALATIAQSLGVNPDGVSFRSVRNDMDSIGFNVLGTTLALRRLIQLGFIEEKEIGTIMEDFCKGYVLTDKGWQWLESNQDKFTLRHEPENNDVPF